MELDQLWLKTCAIFRTDVSDGASDAWLTQLSPLGATEGELYLTGPERVRSWVDLRYRSALGECAGRAAGRELRVVLTDPAEAPAGLASELKGVTVTPVAGSASAPGSFNPRYTFDQFVIGRTNQIAHAAALAVAEQPAQAFNPLFIYGAPGVGKTHLLHSVGNFLRREAGDLAVRYMTAEDFASEFRSVVRDGSIGDFKDGIRRSDVLLIDDVQFLQNKVKTEEEFFHTFNVLYEAGRQLVITCDRTPRELNALADRLRERFESGLVVEIEQPDVVLRSAILRKRAQLDNIPIDDDEAFERIAERAPANVRSLEGALIRVSAFASLRRERITPDLVDELLDSIYPASRQRVSIKQIQIAVSNHYGLTIDDLLSPSRDRRVSAPRQLAMYLACEMTHSNLPAIAHEFGRDHSTVVYARDKLAKSIQADGDLASSIDTLRRVIHGEQSDRASA